MFGSQSKEIIMLSEAGEALKKKQIAKIYKAFDLKPFTERNIAEYKKLLMLLLGEKHGIKVMETIVRDKQVELAS
jgi:hypothetical protein